MLNIILMYFFIKSIGLLRCFFAAPCTVFPIFSVHNVLYDSCILLLISILHDYLTVSSCELHNYLSERVIHQATIATSAVNPTKVKTVNMVFLFSFLCFLPHQRAAVRCTLLNSYYFLCFLYFIYYVEYYLNVFFHKVHRIVAVFFCSTLHSVSHLFCA